MKLHRLFSAKSSDHFHVQNRYKNHIVFLFYAVFLFFIKLLEFDFTSRSIVRCKENLGFDENLEIRKLPTSGALSGAFLLAFSRNKCPLNCDIFLGFSLACVAAFGAPVGEAKGSFRLPHGNAAKGMPQRNAATQTSFSLAMV